MSEAVSPFASLKEQIKRFRDFLLPVSAVLIALLLTLLVTLPKFRDSKTQRAELKRLNTNLEVLKEKTKKLESLYAARATLEDDLALIEDALPSEEGVPTLMTQIQMIATESGVVLSNLQFSGGSAQRKEEEQGGLEAKRVRLQSSLSGSYAVLVSFLRVLETASRVVLVDTLRFTSSSVREEKGGITANLGLVSYYLEMPEVKPGVETPIKIDLASSSFTSLMEKVKALRIYKMTVTTGGEGKPNPFGP